MTLGFHSLHPSLEQISGPWNTSLCAEWDSGSGLVVQRRCSFLPVQQWLLPPTPGSYAPAPTMDLCPSSPESAFNASNPMDVMNSVMTLLGCPPSTLAAWAAVPRGAGGAINTTSPSLLPPACFSFNLFEVMFYDGGFSALHFWRGRRDPYSSTPTSMANMVRPSASILCLFIL